MVIESLSSSPSSLFNFKLHMELVASTKCTIKRSLHPVSRTISHLLPGFASFCELRSCVCFCSFYFVVRNIGSENPAEDRSLPIPLQKVSLLHQSARRGLSLPILLQKASLLYKSLQRFSLFHKPRFRSIFSTNPLVEGRSSPPILLVFP